MLEKSRQLFRTDAVVHDVATVLELDPSQKPTTVNLVEQWRRQSADVNFGTLAFEPTVQSWMTLLNGDAPSATSSVTPHHSEARQTNRSATNKTEDFELSVMQHGYWVGRQKGRELGGVAAHLYVEFDGDAVDPRQLKIAATKLVERHEMLRSRYLDTGRQQIVTPDQVQAFSLVDFSSSNGDDLEAGLERIRAEKTHQRLDVENGQVIDITLSLLPEGRTRLHVDVDMLAADAMSYQILLADLAILYRGEEHTKNSALFTQDRQWWNERIDELPDPPVLSMRPEAAREDETATVRLAVTLDHEKKQRLEERAHRRGVTPAVVLASVFAETQGRWSSEQRFLLSVPLFNREQLHPDTDLLVGDFTNSVLLDVDLSEPATLLDRARALQRKLHSSAAHSHYHGLDVLRDLGKRRGSPVLASVAYTSGLNLDELFAPAVTEVFGAPEWVGSQGPQVVLDAQVVELDGGLLLNWDVRRDIVAPGVIEAMFEYNTSVLNYLLSDQSDWDRPTFDQLPGDQRTQPDAANSTTVDLPARSLHGEFFRHAQMQPDRVGLISETGDATSYRNLSNQALKAASALIDAGVTPGDTVAVRLEKGPQQIVAVLAVLAAGATYLPIAVDHPNSRSERTYSRGQVQVVLGSGGRAPEGLSYVDLQDAINHSEPIDKPILGDPDSLVYVLFTSGSTGEPKGVEIPHAAAANTIDGINHHFQLGADDRPLALSALELDLSVFDIFAPLTVGGAVVCLGAENDRDPSVWAHLIAEHRVSVLNCAPGLLRMLLDAADPDALSSLKTVILGGDSILATTVVARIHGLLATSTARVVDIFRCRTVRALAHQLDEKESNPERLKKISTIYLDAVGIASPSTIRKMT